MEPQPISVIIISVIISSIIGGLLTAFLTIPIAESDHTQYRNLMLISSYLALPIGLSSYLYSQYRAYKKFEREQQTNRSEKQ